MRGVSIPVEEYLREAGEWLWGRNVDGIRRSKMSESLKKVLFEVHKAGYEPPELLDESAELALQKMAGALQDPSLVSVRRQ